MSETVARWIVGVAGAYLGAGLLFAVAFVVRGAPRLDPRARDTGPAFRLLVVPGAAALWPWLAARWARGAEPTEARNAHRDAAARDAR